jgi:hypothetical protein
MGRLKELEINDAWPRKKFFAMVQSPGVWDEREGVSEPILFAFPYHEMTISRLIATISCMFVSLQSADL